MNNYNDLIIKEYNLKYDKKYWICDNIFSNSNLKIIEDYITALPYEFEKEERKNPLSINTDDYILENIPFINDLKKFIITFFNKNFEKKYRSVIEEYRLKPDIICWVNKYSNKILKTTNKNILLPHIDGKIGIVANLWLSKNIDLSCTKLFKYNGDIIVAETELNNTFKKAPPRMIFNNHLDIRTKNRSNILSYTSWLNIDDEEFENNGFEYIGNAPSIYSKMSIYEINTPHIPYIPLDICERNGLSIMIRF